MQGRHLCTKPKPADATVAGLYLTRSLPSTMRFRQLGPPGLSTMLVEWRPRFLYTKVHSSLTKRYSPAVVPQIVMLIGHLEGKNAW